MMHKDTHTHTQKAFFSTREEMNTRLFGTLPMLLNKILEPKYSLYVESYFMKRYELTKVTNVNNFCFSCGYVLPAGEAVESDLGAGYFWAENWLSSTISVAELPNKLTDKLQPNKWRWAASREDTRPQAEIGTKACHGTSVFCHWRN